MPRTIFKPVFDSRFASFLFLCTLGMFSMIHPAKAEPLKFAIVVHGGAGNPSPEAEKKGTNGKEPGLRKALEAGKAILENGGTSLDAVEAAVRVLEDDPHFNAGRGACFNEDGGVEMDASIMEGHTLRCGGVTLVTRTKNPITLAKHVMKDSKHVLIGGEGAERFARDQNLEQVDREYFRTQAQVNAWKRKKAENPNEASNRAPNPTFVKNGATIECDDDATFGTVGCVALDSHGNLAAATSTGGRTYKMVGRIGDSPITGAGNYADDTCAVSGTGVGEEYIRHAVAYDVSAQMRYKNISVEEAVENVLTKRLKPGDGGIIAVDKEGNVVAKFNTKAMAHGIADSNGRFEVSER